MNIVQWHYVVKLVKNVKVVVTEVIVIIACLMTSTTQHHEWQIIENGCTECNLVSKNATTLLSHMRKKVWQGMISYWIDLNLKYIH